MNNNYTKILNRISILQMKLADAQHLYNLYMQNYEIVRSPEYISTTTMNQSEYNKLCKKYMRQIKANNEKIMEYSKELSALQYKLDNVYNGGNF